MGATIALLMQLFSIAFLSVITLGIVVSVVTPLLAVRRGNARPAAGGPLNPGVGLSGRSHDLAKPPKPFGDAALNYESKACKVA
jgi:hypothetical protein